MFMRFIFILLLPFLLQACSTTKYSIDSYKKLTSDLQKNYKIKRADLILSYDLARIDSTHIKEGNLSYINSLPV